MKPFDVLRMRSAGSATNFRYIRFSMTSATNYVQVFEFRAYETFGGANVFQGKTVTVSDFQASFPGSNAVDGSLSTFWASSNTLSTATFTVDAGAGNHFNPVLFSVVPRTFAANQTAHSMLIQGSNDNATWTTLVNIPTLAETVNSEERQFTAGGDDASGYRYLWIKDTGNNFANASVAYAKEIRFTGVNGENIALQNIAFIGGLSAATNANFFGSDTSTNGGAGVGLNVNDVLGLDLGRKRLAPVSISIDHSTVTLYAQHGLKQFSVYGSNTNNIATAVLLRSVNDLTGTPAAGATRTYTLSAAGEATDPLLSLNKLLLGMEGPNTGTTFTDESASPVTFSVGGGTPTTSTVSPLFGNSSLLLPTGVNYISTPSGAVKWDPGSNDFLIEFVVKHDPTQVWTGNITYFKWGSNPTCLLYHFADGSCQLYIRTAAQGYMGCQSAAGAFPADAALHYFAIERAGGTMRLYLGTPGGTASKIAKSTGLTGALEAANAALQIGGWDGYVKGQMDEFRMKIGAGAALYQTDGSYTVPALPFPRA